MRIVARLVFIGLVLAPLLTACGGHPTPPADDTVGTLTTAEIATSVSSAMDPTADPCQDFYRYACGGWLDTTERPADENRWNRAFSTILNRNQEALQTLIEETAQDPGNDPDRRKVADFFSSCMAEDVRDELGHGPLEPMLAAVDAVDSLEGVLGMVGTMHRSGVEALLDVDVFPDFKSPDTLIAYYFQGGLGLPNRDFYLRDDPKNAEIREKYRGHIARMLGLFGAEAAVAEAQAEAIYALEVELAKVSRPPAEMRDLERLYNKIDVAGLQQLTPGLPWQAFLEATGYPQAEDLSVSTPEFFERLETLLQETPMEDLRAYLRWNWINAMASRLDSATDAANFDFYGRVLSGQEEQRPQWKRCVNATDGALGHVVGRLYVERHFAGDSKAVALEMIDDIQEAFRRNLPGLQWMDDTTRESALEKARSITNKIGYPDQWRDYSTLTIEAGKHFENRLAADRFEFARNMGRVGGPADKDEWLMTPPTVNAYYLPTNNEIAFPAGILQPPFFHRSFPAAMNYGAIGAVMGHELTHGFDDSGRKFDAHGQMREWWAPEVAERFEERADCVRQQYDGFEVEPGLNVNGRLTAGENIADLGGVKQSYQAYQQWVERHGEPDPLVEGLTDEQLFFVAYGQVWCTLSTPEAQRMLVQMDSHSPPRFRVQGPLSNSTEFAAAFQCKAGDAMVVENRCEVW